MPAREEDDEDSGAHRPYAPAAVKLFRILLRLTLHAAEHAPISLAPLERLHRPAALLALGGDRSGQGAGRSLGASSRQAMQRWCEARSAGRKRGGEAAARRGEARRGEARQGEARRDGTGRDETRQD